MVYTAVGWKVKGTNQFDYIIVRDLVGSEHLLMFKGVYLADPHNKHNAQTPLSPLHGQAVDKQWTTRHVCGCISVSDQRPTVTDVLQMRLQLGCGGVQVDAATSLTALLI